MRGRDGRPARAPMADRTDRRWVELRRRVAGITGAFVTAGIAACGGIADMTDAAASGTFTVETPSLGAQTFEVDDDRVECLGRRGWEPIGPVETLHVSLTTGPDLEDTRVFFEVSPYGQDGRIAIGGVCDPGFCCGTGPCGTMTLIGRDVVGQGGDGDCWVDLQYAGASVRGELSCAFAADRSREPGTRVHGSFRCAIEE